MGSGFQNFMSNGDSHGTRTRVKWDGVLLNRNLRRILQTKEDRVWLRHTGIESNPRAMNMSKDLAKRKGSARELGKKKVSAVRC